MFHLIAKNVSYNISAIIVTCVSLYHNLHMMVWHINMMVWYALLWVLVVYIRNEG